MRERTSGRRPKPRSRPDPTRRNEPDQNCTRIHSVPRNLPGAEALGGSQGGARQRPVPDTASRLRHARDRRPKPSNHRLRGFRRTAPTLRRNEAPLDQLEAPKGPAPQPRYRPRPERPLRRANPAQNPAAAETTASGCHRGGTNLAPGKPGATFVPDMRSGVSNDRSRHSPTRPQATPPGTGVRHRPDRSRNGIARASGDEPPTRRMLPPLPETAFDIFHGHISLR